MNNRMKEFRSQFNITQEELANKCYVSRQTIISLEKGKYDPSIHLAHRISKIFHTTIEEVFQFDEEEESL